MLGNQDKLIVFITFAIHFTTFIIIISVCCEIRRQTLTQESNFLFPSEEICQLNSVGSSFYFLEVLTVVQNKRII